MVLDIEPLGFPFDYFITKMKKKAKELKMGLDAQKSFAQMHEHGNVNKVIMLEPRKEK